MTDPRYPVGPFEPTGGSLQREKRLALIGKMETFPGEFRNAIARLGAEGLDTPYREGGWTARQVVHHVADSHMNSYIRFKLAATEDAPIIRPYEEGRWAELSDGRSAPIDFSLRLLDALHERWGWWLRRLDESDWRRTFAHPERGTVELDANLEYYAWHGVHHLAHIRMVIEQEGR